MNPETLVIDATAVQLLHTSLIPDHSWFERFATVDRQNRVRSGIVDGIAVIASACGAHDSQLLVVKLGSPNAFSRFETDERTEVFRRILIAALSLFTPHVRIPRTWGTFNAGSKLSFHALPHSSRARNALGVGTRIEVDRNPFGSKHVYAYAFPQTFSDLAASHPDRTSFDSACSAYATFLESGTTASASDAPIGAIQLTDESFFYHSNNLGFKDWYSTRLTAKQREFVDSPLDSPIRLRGAAGTGKTLALAIKLLFAARDALEKGQPSRFLFLTHSTVTSDAINGLLASLDTEGILSRVASTAGYSIEVRTLVDLAWESVGQELEKDNILPLARDALEGHKLQLELIQSVVSDFLRSGDWRLFRPLATDGFVQLMTSDPTGHEFKRLLWELMNEFACVLDANGVHSKPNAIQAYVTEERQEWMMPLPKPHDRKIVLSLYEQFNRLIREMHTISVDQVVSDFLNYLDSFRWNAIKGIRGYDAIFVDELHLFNRQERMVFHGLIRPRGESLPIFMAYDAKQAPSDTFMPGSGRESANEFWTRLKVGSIQKMELVDIFRYTPEIAAFIETLDQAFPGLSLGEEWGVSTFTSSKESNEKPSLTILDDEKELYERVMARAKMLKRKHGEKFTLAVLCCDMDQLETFQNPVAHRKDFVPILSREHAGLLRPDAFRFVLSAPEYVAGLQFDFVMLLDVNRSAVPDGPYSTSARRKFISTVYLGSSRAKENLELYSTKIAGGHAPILDAALARGVLAKVEWNRLPS